MDAVHQVVGLGGLFGKKQIIRFYSCIFYFLLHHMAWTHGMAQIKSASLSKGRNLKHYCTVVGSIFAPINI